MDDELKDLAEGTLYTFAGFAELAEVIPSAGAGVYTIWDDFGELIYVGIAGRNKDSRGLASRLRSHASGRRSGDQFCVSVADRYVLPELTKEQIALIRDSRLSMDALVKSCIHERFSFRLASVDTYATAMSIENAVKGGALGTPPRLNPTRSA